VIGACHDRAHCPMEIFCRRDPSLRSECKDPRFARDSNIEMEKLMSNNAFAAYRMFPAISEAWELQRSGLVIINEQLYKLELWHSFSNPDIPYYVSISFLQGDAWKRMPDPPFAIGRDGDQALRDAMTFLTERLAA
jgi:hypothetical protein